MENNPKPRHMLLIKDDSKITDVFYSALNNLESKHPITVFKNVKLYLKYLKEESMATAMLFFNLNENDSKCLDENSLCQK